jgi:NAD(P)-dependent dehydrogenase (short-subunit alcohol dehydrogenase family)
VSGVAVVVGASSGIGRATAIRFARERWSVALVARGDEGLARLRVKSRPRAAARSRFRSTRATPPQSTTPRRASKTRSVRSTSG